MDTKETMYFYFDQNTKGKMELSKAKNIYHSLL